MLEDNIALTLDLDEASFRALYWAADGIDNEITRLRREYLRLLARLRVWSDPEEIDTTTGEATYENLAYIRNYGTVAANIQGDRVQAARGRLPARHQHGRRQGARTHHARDNVDVRG